MNQILNTHHALNAVCSNCDARHIGICNHLDHSCTDLLSLRRRQAHYDRGKEIAFQGEQIEQIGIISSGLVRVVLLTEDGEEHFIHLLKPGQVVGNPCKAENAFTWEAATPVRICWIKHRTLNQLMLDQPVAFHSFFSIIARQLEDERLWAASMKGCNTLQRIAFWIKQQPPDQGKIKGSLIHIPLTRRDLASWLDMSVETLCRGLHGLAKKGAITMLTPDTVEVTSPEKLEHFARCGENRIGEVLRFRSERESEANPFRISKNIKSNTSTGAV